MIDVVRTAEEASTSNEPQFEPGDLVQHRRYGYRGVVVSFDLTCQADMNWYLSNHSQPDLNQPWYHVFVHNNGTTCTYAAQQNLRADSIQETIIHPWLDYFFAEFNGQKYLRNERPWPEVSE